jgi:hypothetical protein
MSLSLACACVQKEQGSSFLVRTLESSSSSSSVATPNLVVAPSFGFLAAKFLIFVQRGAFGLSPLSTLFLVCNTKSSSSTLHHEPQYQSPFIDGAQWRRWLISLAHGAPRRFEFHPQRFHVKLPVFWSVVPPRFQYCAAAAAHFNYRYRTAAAPQVQLVHPGLLYAEGSVASDRNTKANELGPSLVMCSNFQPFSSNQLRTTSMPSVEVEMVLM